VIYCGVHLSLLKPAAIDSMAFALWLTLHFHSAFEASLAWGGAPYSAGRQMKKASSFTSHLPWQV